MEGLSPYQTILMWVIIALLCWQSLLTAKLNRSIDKIFKLMERNSEEKQNES